MDNITIARRLMAHADTLGQHGSDLYRRRAFRNAAEVLLRLERPAAEIVATEGRSGLKALPGVGASLSRVIEELILTGDFQPRPRPRLKSRRLPCGLVELRPSA
jgi:DNA polymerase (family X)